ncbi:MAG TPA: molybdopterin-dependent oxidoreductase [Acidimicrobiales bacterium]|nr:molybdopterin-dependent oxidoreductase [Acidimicrobiales bacterium]
MRETPPEGITISLDGRNVLAKPGEMLIAAAERAGTYIPRFCYHPRMEPVGMCRMCLVEVDGPRGATLQPACFIAVAEGMVVGTTSEKVKKAQDGVLEFLLANHPLDCPVCDKGGECPLQDQTLAYGPGESRFIEEKRHFEKPIAISDLVLLDRERCIQCARCTRFASEVAGEAQIDFSGRGEQVEVSTFPTEPFSSYFSGNTVQICPVGALTATPYRFTARPWDLDQVESTCTACAVGCRIAVQSSSNRLTRLLGIDSDPVNHGWLCDKGRFAFESVNGDEVSAGPLPEQLANDAVDVAPATAAQVVGLGVSRGQFLGESRETGRFEHGRLIEPKVRKNGELVAVSWGEALAAAAAGLSAAREAGGAGTVAMIGGSRLTNESAYAWAKLAKGIIGTDSVDAQLGDGLPADLVLRLPRATIDGACAAPLLITLTGDLREELPVLFLRLREAVVGGTSLIEIAPAPTALSALATATLAMRPGDAALVARALVGDEPAVSALAAHPQGSPLAGGALQAARAALAERPDGEGVVIVVGRPSYAESGELVAEAARVLAGALPRATFLPALRRGNIFGALDMGLAPGLLPGRVSLESGREWFAAAWGSVPERTGLDTAGILASMAGPAGGDAVTALILLGSDPLGDFPDRTLALAALAAGHFVVAVTGHPSESVDAHADVVLPCAVAHERPGTTTNMEGRVSRLGHKLTAPGFAWPDWMIASELAAALGADLGVSSANDLADELHLTAPAYAGLTQAVLHSAVAHDGILVPIVEGASRRADVEPIDPVALPGVEAVERQGAPPRVGMAGGDGAAHLRVGALGQPPALLSGPGPAGADAARVPPADSYALRLVAGRRLYDAGSSVTGSPSLTPLVPTLVARANPYDLDRLGAGTGDRVRLRSARGELVLPAEAHAGIPRGTVAVDFNVPSGPEAQANAVSSLIDSRKPVTDVRMESV